MSVKLDRNRSAASGALPDQSPVSEAPAAAETAAPAASAKDAEKTPVDAFTAFANSVNVGTEYDDPFVTGPHLDRMPIADFTLGSNGKPIGLEGPNVKVNEDPNIARQGADGIFKDFANNPWTKDLPNRAGNFPSENEPRFPGHEIARDASGKAVLDAQGLQQWKTVDQHLGQTTMFDAANTAKRMGAQWSGRPINWGVNGQMTINPHAFLGFNAFFSPAARQLFFGVVPYRLWGETTPQQIKTFEFASSWEVAAHESGHAVHHELKPNIFPGDLGFRQWGESFADQMALWAQLQDPERVGQILRQHQGRLNMPSLLSGIGEFSATLLSEGTALRDAWQNKAVNPADKEVHDASEPMTGATFKVFERMSRDFEASGEKPQDAVLHAATVMGTFLTRACDFTPENVVSLEDVGKAYLSVDKEYFGGKYGTWFAEEFANRGIFKEHSVDPKNPDPAGFKSSEEQWAAHAASVPAIQISAKPTKASLGRMVSQHAADLGVPAGFGLKLQSFLQTDDGKTVVRVSLTQGTGADATPLGNQGVMTFRKDGTLADFESAWPRDLTADRATELLKAATDKGLVGPGQEASLAPRLDAQDRFGDYFRTPTGKLSYTVNVISIDPGKAASGLNAQYKVTSLEDPTGRKIDPGADEFDGYLQAFGNKANSSEIMTDDVIN